MFFDVHIHKHILEYFSKLEAHFYFQSLRKLKTLDMHGNHIKELKRNQFKNLRDLESLDISYNEITKLESSHIADLTKLGFCNISYNVITEISR